LLPRHIDPIPKSMPASSSTPDAGCAEPGTSPKNATSALGTGRMGGQAAFLRATG
jgi:hypothetical protein